MGKERIKVNVPATSIAAQLRKDEKFSQGVRLYVVYQVALGRKPEELQSVYNTSSKAIYNWVHRFNAQGAGGLKDLPRSGRPSRLNDESRAKLKQVVLSSPLEHGFTSGTWTRALVSEYIRHVFGVEYRKAQIYNILHSLGLSFQKGKGYFPEAESREEAVSSIKKTSGAKSRQRDTV
jgi:transposase